MHIPNQGGRIDLSQQMRPLARPLSNDGNNNTKTMSKCGLCPSEFGSAEALIDHLGSHHKLAKEMGQFQTFGELFPMEVKCDIVCSECNSAFKTLGSYYTHIKTHIKPPPPKQHSQNGFEGDRLFLGEFQAFGERFQHGRDELDMNAEEESDLTRFFAEAEDDKKSSTWNFTCDACGRKFVREAVYQYHVLLHRGERPYSCTECAKAFKSGPVLMLHEKCHEKSGVKEESTVLGNGLTYQCSICDKLYDNKTSLRDHEIQHSVDGEFTCKVCGKKFRSLIGLKIHSNKHQNDLIQQHLNGSVKKPDQNGGSSGGDGDGGKSLLYYEEVDGVDKERPYICRVCDKRFKTKHALPYHMLLHTAETPFVCEFCGKGFRALISLKLHAKKHEGKGWNPSFDHLEMVQRQYQQAILMMGETRCVAQGKPPAITEVIPFAKAVAMAPQVNSTGLGRTSMMRMDEEEFGHGDHFYGQRRPVVGRGSASGDEEVERDQDEPNIQDFCAIEMMMEPEVEISEEQGNAEMETEDHQDGTSTTNGEMDESGYVNGSQYAHLYPDEGEDDGPAMLQNEAKSDDDFEANGHEMGADEEAENEEEHHPNGHSMDSNEAFAKLNTEQLLQKAMQPQALAVDSILKYECPICFKRFKNRLSLPYHMMTHERGDPVNCNYCNRKFVSKMKLRRHLRVKHDVVDPDLGDDENEEPKPPVSRFGKFQFACPTCNRKFKSKFTLKLHVKHHHYVRGRLGQPPKYMGQGGTDAEHASQMPKISKVESVSSSFLDGANVALLQSLMHNSMNGQGVKPEDGAFHEMTFPAQPPTADAQFDCDQCDQKFATFVEYKLHMKFHLEQIASAASVSAAVQSSAVATNSHTDGKPKARYDMQNSYRLSKEYEHLRTKEGKYQCNICHKLFKCRQSLPYHMNLHKKNSIFRCLSCKTGFRNLHGFKMHNRIYHKDRLDSATGRRTEGSTNFLKQEANVSGDQLDPQNDESRHGAGDSEHSMASSSYKTHHNGDGADEDHHTNSSVKQESVEDMDLTSLMNHSMTTDQLVNHPFSLFPPGLLQLQQLQQLQLQMQQQMVGSGVGGNGGGSSSASVASDGGGVREKTPLITGQVPEMRPFRLETGERGYLCSLCNKVCRSKQASIYHRMIHSGEKPYKCVICDKRCRSKANLELHKKMHVNELKAENGAMRRRSRFRSDEVEGGVLPAAVEPVAMENDGTAALTGLGMLQMMMGGGGSASGGSSAGNAGDSSVDSSMQKWRAYADMKMLRCTQCEYKFKSVQALTYHCMIHTNEKPYKCQICSNSFRSKTNLNLHEKSHQRAGEGGGNGLQQYDDNMEITLETLQNCPEVANGFLNASSGPAASAAGTSRNVSPVNCFCLVCEKTFRTEGYVRHHQLLVHTVRSDVNVNELPTLVASQDGYMYRCDVCQNCFRTKQYYYFHVNTHHAEGGELWAERGN